MDILSFILGYTKGKSQGGGGSSEEGLTLTVNTTHSFYGSKNNMFFTLNGELYSIWSTTSGKAGVHKHEADGTKTLIVKDVSYTINPSDGSHWVECNGKVWFYGHYDYYAVFDGTTLTFGRWNTNSPIIYFDTGKRVESFRGKLYGSNDNLSTAAGVYVYDEDTATWSLYYSTTNRPYIYVIGDNLYITSNTANMLTCITPGADNNEYSIGTLMNFDVHRPNNNSDGVIFTYNQTSNKSVLYKSKIGENTSTNLGYIPSSSGAWLIEYNGEFLVGLNGGSSYLNQLFTIHGIS